MFDNVPALLNQTSLLRMDFILKIKGREKNKQKNSLTLEQSSGFQLWKTGGRDEHNVTCVYREELLCLEHMKTGNLTLT